MFIRSTPWSLHLLSSCEPADDIAIFLSGANPNWPKQTLVDMLYKHLDYTTIEVVSRLKKEWVADVEAYDRGHDHRLMFSDALTEGLIKQFPKKLVKWAVSK